MQKLQSIRQAWKLFSTLSFFWRLHQVGRSLLIPFQQLVDYLPAQGSLLDLGCGHGLFLALAKQEHPALQVIGLDLSEEKIAAARKALSASDCTLLHMDVQNAVELYEQSFDVISIIDVLYLIPIGQWDNILKRCYSYLKPGGKLMLKEMNRSITWKFALLYIEETIVVKMLGLTLGKQFTFPGPEEIRYLLVKAGFEVEEIPLDRFYLVPHQLWIGVKQKD
jgi:2-polyprenyl-3-methyl-5-hydroxy-6-metoxy-1,4-benzoquinol methylase